MMSELRTEVRGVSATPPSPGRGLEILNVSAQYDRVPVLNGVTLHAAPDEVTVVFGPNGAGKTTLLRVAAGLLTPTAGRVHVGGQDVTGWTPRRRLDDGIMFLPSGGRTFSTLSVRSHLDIFSSTSRATDDDIAAVAEYFPVLRDRLGQSAGTLSGGERAMLSLARVVLRTPKVVLLDEPTVGLAPIAIATMFDAITRMRREVGAVVLIVEQQAQVRRLADAGYLLAAGHIVGHRYDAGTIPRAAELQRAYLAHGGDRIQETSL